MKQLAFILSIMVLTSCSETFNTIDPKAFNEKIANRTDITTPEALMKLYYNYPEGENNPKLKIESKKLSDHNFEITLIHEGIEDDSQSGEKIVMKAKQIGQTWTASEIKKNWKCYKGRGHTNWGTERCK